MSSPTGLPQQFEPCVASAADRTLGACCGTGASLRAPSEAAPRDAAPIDPSRGDFTMHEYLDAVEHVALRSERRRPHTGRLLRRWRVPPGAQRRGAQGGCAD
ncbi:Uncharacterized protein OBRU01_18024 [Operophtera brumata]|uniref:Uncharacterized protein n=1 Tax=Operophtera brumata TaxID=104452 RepID=A0A0L7KZI3_OPEBR|nr:Uncharacterized protein OBRU01_18024 [Operophtera brumata]